MQNILLLAKLSTRVPITRAMAQTLGQYFAILLMWAVLASSTPYFLTVQNIRNIFLQSAVMGILAAGFTVILIAGEIDLSIATVQAFAGTLAAIFIIKDGMSIWVAMSVVMGVSFLIGVLNGYFTVYVKIPSFIVTLATLSIAQGLGFVLASGRTIGGFPSSYHFLGRASLGPVPVPVAILVAVYLIFHLILTQTKFGLELYAVGGSRLTAERVGLNTPGVLVSAFMISAMLAGFAGLILSSRLNAGHGSFGATMLLDAVAAVVIGGSSLSGGSGSLIGTFAGVIIITTIQNGLVHLGVDPFWQQVAVGVIVVGAVALDQLIKGRLRLRDLVPFIRRKIGPRPPAE